jgi:hypothetical protein
MSKKKIKKPSAAARLKELEKEHAKGVESIKALDNQRSNLVQTVLRIEGAMQAYREQINPPDGKEEPPDGTKPK